MFNLGLYELLILLTGNSPEHSNKNSATCLNVICKVGPLQIALKIAAINSCQIFAVYIYFYYAANNITCLIMLFGLKQLTNKNYYRLSKRINIYLISEPVLSVVYLSCRPNASVVHIAVARDNLKLAANHLTSHIT